MKKLLTILLLLPLIGLSQSVHKFVLSPGEYTGLALDTFTHVVYDITLGKLNTVNGAPHNVHAIYSGAHHACMTDSVLNAYCYLDNSTGELGLGNTNGASVPTKITRDSIGNAMLPVAGMSLGATDYANYWYTMAWSTIATGGVLYIWGNTQGGAEGNGTWGCATSTLPVRITFSGGAVIKKAIASNLSMALDTAGNPWTWGFGGYTYPLGQGGSPTFMVPTKIVISAEAGHKAIDIAQSGYFNYILYDDGNLYANGGQYNNDYIAIYPSLNVQTTFQKINNSLNLPAPIAKIGVHNESTFVILTDSTLWGWGGNVQGTIGIGTEVNFAIYGCCPFPSGTTTLYPYAWDQAQHELQQIKPVNMAVGKHNFTDIFVTSALDYGAYFEDANNILYVAGRDKGLLAYGIQAANITNGAIQNAYPNSWDVIWLKQIPYLPSITTVYQATSPFCIHGSSTACSIYTPPSHTPPTAVFTGGVINGNTIVLNNAGSTDQYFIQRHIMTQTSGPVALGMGVHDALNDTITTTATGSSIPNGTYVFQLKLVNNNWDSTFATVTVVVGAAPPTVNAGADQVINPPFTASTLFGTVTPSGGTSIVSTSWTQVSGPNVAIIANAAQLSTSISGLVPGTYVFQLSATDNNNNTGTDRVQVLVNAGPSTQQRNFIILHRYHAKSS